MKIVYTHTSPDMDAAASTWLALRVLGGDKVAFLAASEANPEDAFAVCDRGREYDPARLRFDHHGFAGREASATSATEQVYVYTFNSDLIGTVGHLVDVITDCDGRNFTGDMARWSFRHGLHAVFSAWKAQHLPDHELIRLSHEMLDRYYNIAYPNIETAYSATVQVLFAAFPEYADLARSTAAALDQAGEEYEKAKVWESRDGRVVAVRNVSKDAVNYGIMTGGAHLVVWASEVKDASGAVIGIARGAQANTERCHAGELVDQAIIELDRDDDFVGWISAGERVWAAHEDIAAELKTWFCHPAGFMAGITPKGDPKLLSNMQAPLEALAIALFWAMEAQE